jgi:hypothetical protein
VKRKLGGKDTGKSILSVDWGLGFREINGVPGMFNRKGQLTGVSGMFNRKGRKGKARRAQRQRH